MDDDDHKGCGVCYYEVCISSTGFSPGSTVSPAVGNLPQRPPVDVP